MEAESSSHSKSRSKRRDVDESDKHKSSSHRNRDDDSERHGKRDRDRDDQDRHQHRHSHSHKDRDRDRERERSPKRDRKEREDERDDKKRKRDRDSASGGSRRDKGKDRERERDSERKSSKRERKDKERATSIEHDHLSSTSQIPTSSSLSLSSNLQDPPEGSIDPQTNLSIPATSVQRDDWMMSSSSKTVSNLARPLSSSKHQADAEEKQEFEMKEDQDNQGGGGEDYFFSNLGSEQERKKRKTKEEEEKPDPEKLKISKNELNHQLVEGKKVDEYEVQAPTKIAPGAPGHQWRMMKLRRIYEQAEEEKRPVEEVALERYDSMESFNEARRERQFLDERDRQKSSNGSNGRRDSNLKDGKRRDDDPNQKEGGRKSFMFTDSPINSSSRPSSRESFRKPGESNPSTPLGNNTPIRSNDQVGSNLNPINKRLDRFVQNGYESPAGSSVGGSKPSTPIPNVFAPTRTSSSSSISQKNPISSDDFTPSSPSISTSKDRSRTSNNEKGIDPVSQAVRVSNEKDNQPPQSLPLDASALNKLKAKLMKAELMGDSKKAEQLKKEFDEESLKAKNWIESGNGKGGDVGGSFLSIGQQDGDENPNSVESLQVLPTLDGRGRLYDVGHGKPGDEDDKILPGNRRPKKNKFETHDPKTGEMIRRNQDDDSQSLAELVRQEKFAAGSSSQKNMDAEMAGRIAGDTRFKNDLEYLDENVERLARKQMKSDAMKRQFAIQDFARTKKALDECPFCWQNEGSSPPSYPIISSGIKTYLTLPSTEPLTSGHCYIVPMFHHLSLLEAEDDVWDEVRNFMKCLMRNAASKNEGVIFWETVVSLKWQKHSFIEAINLPMDLYQDMPAYFKESILSSESEWTQHQKLIDFSLKPFRRSMVPNLPYFMVQWDYKGEKGYGHVIEGDDDGLDDEDDSRMKSSNQGFPKWFGAEVVGSQLDLEPRRWRNPKKMDKKLDEKRLKEFRNGWGWDSVDWTKMLK